MFDSMNLSDFLFADRFIGLTSDEFEKALLIVKVQFSGIRQLWGFLPPPEAFAKRRLCLNYLIAWQLANMLPNKAAGVASTGALPLSSKKAGPIFIKYRDGVRQAGTGVLDALTSNEFGNQALMMIQGAPENYLFFA